MPNAILLDPTYLVLFAGVGMIQTFVQSKSQFRSVIDVQARDHT